MKEEITPTHKTALPFNIKSSNIYVNDIVKIKDYYLIGSVWGWADPHWAFVEFVYRGNLEIWLIHIDDLEKISSSP